MKSVQAFGVFLGSCVAMILLEGCKKSDGEGDPNGLIYGPPKQVSHTTVESAWSDWPVDASGFTTKDAPDCRTKGSITVFVQKHQNPEYETYSGFVRIASGEYSGKRGLVRLIMDSQRQIVSDEDLGKDPQDNENWKFEVQIEGVTKQKTYARNDLCTQVMDSPPKKNVPKHPFENDLENHKKNAAKYMAKPSSRDAEVGGPAGTLQVTSARNWYQGQPGGAQTPAQKTTSTLQADSTTLAGVHKHRMSSTKPNEVKSSHSRSIDDDNAVVIDQ